MVEHGSAALCPEGFEPFLLRFTGADRNIYEVAALRVAGSCWCVSPAVARNGAAIEGEWRVSHIGGVSIGTYSLGRKCAFRAALSVASCAPWWRDIDSVDRDRIARLIGEIVAEAETLDLATRYSASRYTYLTTGEAHA